jgi:hypothetical protein
MMKTKKIEACEHYTAGPVMGKTRPICAYYISTPPESAGGCTRHDHFMCEYWTRKEKNNEKRKKEVS